MKSVMSVVGTLLFVLLFAAVTAYKVKPEWFHSRPPKLTRIDPDVGARALANTRAACERYAQAAGWFATSVEASEQRLRAAGTDLAAGRDELARLSALIDESLPKLRAVQAPALPVGARHEAWVASIDRMGDAIDLHLQAVASGDGDRTARSVRALDEAMGDYEARKRETVAGCPD